MNKKDLLNNFYKELSKFLLKNNDNYENEYLQILNKYQNKIESIKYNLNTSKKKLDEYFKINQINLKIIIEYQIFHIFKKKKIYLKNKELFIEIIKK